MGMWIFAVFLFLLLLLDLLTGRVRMRYGGAIIRNDRPGAYWGSISWECLIVGVVVLAALHKLPPKETVIHGLMAGLGGLFCCVIISILFDWVWKPGRHEVLGIGSPRTVALYAACVLSVPAILALNLRSSFRLEFLFVIPVEVMILAVMSARKDSYR